MDENPLDTWVRKWKYLQIELAKVPAGESKFKLQEDIKEAEEQVRELAGKSGNDPLAFKDSQDKTEHGSDSKTDTPLAGQRPPQRRWPIWFITLGVFAGLTVGLLVGWGIHYLVSPPFASAKEQELQQARVALTQKEQELLQLQGVVGKLTPEAQELQRVLNNLTSYSPLDDQLKTSWGDGEDLDQQWDALRARGGDIAFRVLQLGPFARSAGGRIQILFGVHSKVRYQVFTKEKGDPRPGVSLAPLAPRLGSNPVDIHLPICNAGATLFILVSLLPPDTKEFSPASEKEWYNQIHVKRLP